MLKKSPRHEVRAKRHLRARKKIGGSPTRPRLSVFRSQKQVYAQLIDDTNSITLVSASSIETETKGKKKTGAPGKKKAEKPESQKADGQKTAAQGPAFDAEKAVGALIAKRAMEKGIKAVVFDRGGYQYHGRVAALAQAAREGGLCF